MGTELLHLDGQMEGQAGLTKLIVAFCNFSKAPKRVHSLNNFGKTSVMSEVKEKRSIFQDTYYSVSGLVKSTDFVM